MTPDDRKRLRDAGSCSYSECQIRDTCTRPTACRSRESLGRDDLRGKAQAYRAANIATGNVSTIADDICQGVISLLDQLEAVERERDHMRDAIIALAGDVYDGARDHRIVIRAYREAANHLAEPFSIEKVERLVREAKEKP